MSPATAFHAQLASIMEVLANTAVAEICELVDSGYSVLQLEISRSRKENEVLRRKLRLMELRAARTNALRAAATGSALLVTSGRTRVPPPGEHSRRTEEPRGEVAPPTVSTQETVLCGTTGASLDSGLGDTRLTPASADSAEVMTAGIKVEASDESWSRSEENQELRCVIDGLMTETEAPPPLIKKEVANVSDVTPGSWMSGDVLSTSWSRQNTERQVQRGTITTQDPLSEDPGCSYVNPGLGISTDCGGGGNVFKESATEQRNHRQGAPLPAREPRVPVRKHAADRQTASIRRDGWRRQDNVTRTTSHGRGDAGTRMFVCNCCGKTLASLKNLNTHMRVHTGEKPFVCALCGKRFSDPSNLKRHQSVHTGEKRYGCVHCGKRFAQSGSLKVHMSVHTDCKQFRCSCCGKTFISGSHLRRHATVHIADKRSTLP